MTPKSLAWFAFAAFSLQMGAAQDFKKSYPATPGQIWIDTISGNIKILGYKGQDIEIIAYKKGSDSSSIEIQEEVKDGSMGKWVFLRARFPQLNPGKLPPGGFEPGKVPPEPGRFGRGPFGPGKIDTGNDSVDFEIRVPKQDKIENKLVVHTVNGNVEAANLFWNIDAATDIGVVDLKDVRGNVTARSRGIGSIKVDLGAHKESSEMHFFSMNGSVTVKAPGNLDAHVFMSSDSGQLQTDFPVKVQDNRYGRKRTAEGTLGSGQRQTIHIISMWGSVSFLKK